MKQTVYYNPDSMALLKKEIVNYGQKLVSELNKISLLLDTIGELYDTPSGTLYKDKFKEYIENRKQFVQNKYLPLEEVVTFAINKYDENNKDVSTMVGDN